MDTGKDLRHGEQGGPPASAWCLPQRPLPSVCIVLPPGASAPEASLRPSPRRPPAVQRTRVREACGESEVGLKGLRDTRPPVWSGSSARPRAVHSSARTARREGPALSPVHTLPPALPSSFPSRRHWEVHQVSEMGVLGCTSGNAPGMRDTPRPPSRKRQHHQAKAGRGTLDESLVAVSSCSLKGRAGPPVWTMSASGAPAGKGLGSSCSKGGRVGGYWRRKKPQGRWRQELGPRGLGREACTREPSIRSGGTRCSRGTSSLGKVSNWTPCKSHTSSELARGRPACEPQRLCWVRVFTLTHVSQRPARSPLPLGEQTGRLPLPQPRDSKGEQLGAPGRDRSPAATL